MNRVLLSLWARDIGSPQKFCSKSMTTATTKGQEWKGREMREAAPIKYHHPLLGYQIWDNIQIWNPLTESQGPCDPWGHEAIHCGSSLRLFLKGLAQLCLKKSDTTERLNNNKGTYGYSPWWLYILPKKENHRTFQELQDSEHQSVYSLSPTHPQNPAVVLRRHIHYMMSTLYI